MKGLCPFHNPETQTTFKQVIISDDDVGKNKEKWLISDIWVVQINK